MFEIQNKHIQNSGLKIGDRVQLPSVYGTFELIPFLEEATGKEHIVLIKGKPENQKDVLVRIHSACATGDLFGSMPAIVGNNCTCR